MATATADLKEKNLIVSSMAETLIGSEIIFLAWQINEKIAKGQKISNLTIGDFNPKIFPIPHGLRDEIKRAYDENETNYPPAEGSMDLRKEISKYMSKRLGLNYGTDEILVTSGARPVIFAAYNTVVDVDETVIFPVPSWNNNHYTHLTRSRAITVETRPENNFMPTADELRPFIREANLISLCSPLNPTGTAFSEQELRNICELVLEENDRRGSEAKPVYILYDQVYWQLTHGDTKHYNPVSIDAGMKDYTIFVDGISKVFASTGVRVGWGFGPKKLIDKMKSITSHMGAWAPKAEQVAVSRFLANEKAVDEYLSKFKVEIADRLHGFYDKFIQLKNEGYNVDAIAPQASIFMTVKVDLIGKKKPDGSVISCTQDITDFLIEDAKVALVPFASFGSSPDSTWYRVSVGTCTLEQINSIMNDFREALSKLS